MNSALMSRRAIPLSLVGAGLALAETTHSAESRWKVLLVAAHPDDEYYFAATVYRLAQELGAVVDHVIITNGEGGYRYSALAEKIYGEKLTDEQVGRAKLPEIRKRETMAAGRILGIRHHYFLGQRDARFTLDAGEAERIWDCHHLRESLHELMQSERYDFVFTLLPRESEHGHHKEATLLAMAAAASLPTSQRPVVLGAEPGHSQDSVTFAAPHSEPIFVFERKRNIGSQGALRYDIVVNWVIAEHKSQGLFQNDQGAHDVERFWLLDQGLQDAISRTARLAADLVARPRAMAGY